MENEYLTKSQLRRLLTKHDPVDVLKYIEKCVLKNKPDDQLMLTLIDITKSYIYLLTVQDTYDKELNNEITNKAIMALHDVIALLGFEDITPNFESIDKHLA